jgi:hypothetical protein
MEPRERIEEVYARVDQLAVDLKAAGVGKLAAVLDHRLHKVAWTTQSELLEELRKILSRIDCSERESLPKPLAESVKALLSSVEAFLRDSDP